MGSSGSQTSGNSWKHDRRSRHERGYGRAWEKLRASALRRDDYLCQPCKRTGRITPATECDHITPKAKGGTDSLNNVQGICSACHRDKTSQEAAEAQGRRIKQSIGRDGWPTG